MEETSPQCAWGVEWDWHFRLLCTGSQASCLPKISWELWWSIWWKTGIFHVSRNLSIPQDALSQHHFLTPDGSLGGRDVCPDSYAARGCIWCAATKCLLIRSQLGIYRVVLAFFSKASLTKGLPSARAGPCLQLDTGGRKNTGDGGGKTEVTSEQTCLGAACLPEMCQGRRAACQLLL